MDITTGDFHRLNEVLTDLIGDVYPNFYVRRINGKEIFGGIVNAHLVKNHNETPLVDDPMENLHNKYRRNTSLLQNVLISSYDDEIQGHKTRNLVVQPLDASNFQLIFQVLLDISTFNHYTLVLRVMAALIVPPVTGKRKTSLALIAVAFCVSNGVARSTIQFEQLHWRCTEAKKPTDNAVVSYVSSGSKFLVSRRCYCSCPPKIPAIFWMRGFSDTFLCSTRQKRFG